MQSAHAHMHDIHPLVLENNVLRYLLGSNSLGD